jgi:hypothetical protein
VSFRLFPFFVTDVLNRAHHNPIACNLCEMRKISRWLLAVATAIFIVWLLHDIWHAIRMTPDQIRTVELDQSRAVAFQFLREDSRRFVDAAMLVLAGLWSVAVVGKDERLRHRDTPELLMFAVATVLLFSFFYFTQQFESVLERSYWDTASAKLFPDVFNSPYLTMYSHVATITFFGGLFVSAITIFSLCMLRESNHSECNGIKERA